MPTATPANTTTATLTDVCASLVILKRMAFVSPPVPQDPPTSMENAFVTATIKRLSMVNAEPPGSVLSTVTGTRMLTAAFVMLATELSTASAPATNTAVSTAT